MAIKVTITIDEDRWAKHPYRLEFDNSECNRRFGHSSLDTRSECYKLIKMAQNTGFEIDPNINEQFC